jgi:hypothetical protein
MVNEQDRRLQLLNSLLTTPHRDLASIWPFHRDLANQDPRFYVRLAAWYAEQGAVRDHKEMFVIALALSGDAGLRDVGLALVRTLPPYEVARVVDFVHGRRSTAEGKAAADYGLFRNVPRSLRTEVIRYLREREADADWFDSTVLNARKALKRLYALLHVKPGERAQAVLFDERPPEGSRLAALKALAKAASPAEQAAAITTHRIPYRVASAAIKAMTPEVMLALVEQMSPQEVINVLGALKKRGALKEPAVKAVVERKLDQAKSAKRVSAFKATVAAQAAGDLGDAIERQLEAVADTQIKARGRISRPTALLIDKSGSMEQAIELGKRIGAMLSTVCECELYVYAFDTIAYPIEAAGANLADWERALTGIQAGGGTSVGCAVEVMRLKKQSVEQIIVVTDEGENTAPLLGDSLRKYREQLQADPAICFVKTPGATDQLEKACQQLGIPADAFAFTGDYYSLPNLIPLLTKPSKLELLMEIMDYPLPARRSA